MANIVINADVSKLFKNEASGIASGIRGKNMVGLIDVRPIRYKNKSRHIAGLKYDESKRVFYMTTPEKGDGVNLGIFITTYDIELVEGKILAREVIDDIYEVSSVAEKYTVGGYDDVLERAKKKKEVNPEIFPRKVDLQIIVATAPKKISLRNSKGFIFTCDFASGKWYVLRPGTKKAVIYKMNEMDFNAANVFREQLPFPALDRKIYDNKTLLESGEFSLKKHILTNV
jgi:hypothetical protein